MRHILALIITLTYFSAGAQGLYINEDNEQQMWGEIKVEDFLTSPFESWFRESQDVYQPKINDALVANLKKSKDLKVIIYMGTWCSDSQEWVPKFVKLWKAMGLTMDNVTIIGVHDADDKRKHAPDGSHEKYNIEYVPTFIFLKNGKEIGRIVEYPQAELEDDIATIILQQ